MSRPIGPTVTVIVAPDRQVVDDVGSRHLAGARLDVDEDTAYWWIRRGWAVELPEPGPPSPAPARGVSTSSTKRKT